MAPAPDQLAHHIHLVILREAGHPCDFANRAQSAIMVARWRIILTTKALKRLNITATSDNRCIPLACFLTFL